MKKTTNKEIENARQILKKAGYFVQNLWSMDDVKETARQNNIILNDEQCIILFDF